MLWSIHKPILKGRESMKKIIAGLLAIALTAAVSIGATLAYLTDTDEDVNVMTLGNVKIDQLEYERTDVESKNEDATVQEFHDNKPIYPAVTEKDFDYTPGDTNVDWTQIGKNGYTSEIWNPEKINNEIDKMVFAKNKGTSDAYVRTWFAFEANGYTVEQFKELFHLNINTTDWTWEWEEAVAAIPNADGTETTNYVIAVATYNKVLEPGKLTEISLSQVALDSSATNESVAGFGDTYQILVKTQAIQTQGFDTPAEALTEGFGITHPFETDAPTKGTTMMNALHYLNGDTTGTKITAKVSNVVYGFNKDHGDIVDAYTGTLVDVEQDVPVYAYYVPNGSNYDIYFLANDAIYAPRDCTDLFLEMKALKSVDTSNLNMSRTQILYKMFRLCGALTDIDVSNWNTSNVTSMRALFSGASSLASVDTTNWDTSNVIEMNNMFNGCTSLVEVKGTENWDTSNVTSMVQMFINCTNLTTVDVGNWDTGKVTRFKAMFASTAQNQGNMKFTDLDIENWDMSSATDLEAMFYGCGQLTSIDMSKWDISKVTKMAHMFSDCFKLQSIDMSNWNTESLTCLDAMFNHCTSLKTIDVSSFTTDKVKEFSQMFEACSSLEKIIGLEKFNTANGQDFSEMFNGCSSLKELDLSTFVTVQSNKDYITYYPWNNCMFERFISGCSSLEKITFGPSFSFDGDGTAPASYKCAMPAATKVEGWDGKWYNADTGVGYLPSEVPDMTAATYVAVKPATA